jgi:sec-independent protein translocase protein TatC
MWMLFETGLLFGALVKRRSEHEAEAQTENEDTPNDQPPAAQQ